MALGIFSIFPIVVDSFTGILWIWPPFYQIYCWIQVYEPVSSMGPVGFDTV